MSTEASERPLEFQKWWDENFGKPTNDMQSRVMSTAYHAWSAALSIPREESREVPKDRLEAIAADEFCEFDECTTHEPRIGVCPACDAIYAARECLRLRVLLGTKAVPIEKSEVALAKPSDATGKVTYIVSYPNGSVCDARSESQARWLYKNGHAGMQADTIVKLTTTEEVIETRQRKSE